MSKICIKLKPGMDHQIEMTHFMPFDPTNGIKHSDGRVKTEAELVADGFIVLEQGPEPEQKNGYNAVGYYDPELNIVYYKYESTSDTVLPANAPGTIDYLDLLKRGLITPEAYTELTGIIIQE